MVRKGLRGTLICAVVAGALAAPASGAVVQTEGGPHGYRGVAVGPHLNVDNVMGLALEPMDVTVTHVATDGQRVDVADRGVLLLGPLLALGEGSGCAYTAPLRSATCPAWPYISGVRVAGGPLGDRLVVQGPLFVVAAGGGDDVVDARGAQSSMITCGPGIDTVRAGAGTGTIDRSCERVTG